MPKLNFNPLEVPNYTVAAGIYRRLALRGSLRFVSEPRRLWRGRRVGERRERLNHRARSIHPEHFAGAHLHLKGRFNLDLRLDSTNLLNHATFTSWYTNITSTQFGLPTIAANAMRSIQTTLRLRF